MQYARALNHARRGPRLMKVKEESKKVGLKLILKKKKLKS